MVKVYHDALSRHVEPDEISLVNSFSISFAQIFEQLHKEIRAGALDERTPDEVKAIQKPCLKIESPLIGSSVAGANKLKPLRICSFRQ